MEELKAGGPALGPPGQLSELFGRKRLAVEIAKETFDFPRTKAQVFAADLEQGTRDSQPREVEPGKRARADQERDAGRGVVDEPLEGELGRTVLEGVEIIDDEERAAPSPGLERASRRFDRLPPIRNPPEDGGEGRLQVAEQGAGFGVPALGAIPGDRHFGGGGEAGQQRALSRAGRRDDESDPMLPDAREQRIDAFPGKGLHLRDQHLG